MALNESFARCENALQARVPGPGGHNLRRCTYSEKLACGHASGHYPWPQMRIPEDAIIAREKLTGYLLVQRQSDDKSKFLRGLGFTLANWSDLALAIRNLARSVHAVEDGENEYGNFYRIDGPLIGPMLTRAVALIWMHRSAEDQFHFVTLKPAKE